MTPLGRDLRRLAHLVRTVTRHGGAAWLLNRWPTLAGRLGLDRLTAPERLRTMLQEMGGSFVKLGQMLALQPDLVPPAYYLVLQDLLDRVPAISWDEVSKVIREETSLDALDIFDSLESAPIATASLAQVHVGRLLGHKVAIKVQRPQAEAEFGSDVRWAEAVLGVIGRLRLKKLLWLREPLEEFVAWTREELDFRCEARYTQQLGRFAEHNAVQSVPRVYGKWTTRRLLVVDFLDGPTLLEYLRAGEEQDSAAAQRRLEPPGFDRNRVARNVIDNFVHDAFENGIYHADLHPGNLLILENSVIGYIDFGITGVINRHARKHLVSMTLALVTGNMELLYRQFLELAAPDSRADRKLFRDGLDRLAVAWYSPEEKSLRVNFTRIMTDMLTLSRQSYVLPERDIVKYIRSSIAIDGLITRFAPGFDVGEHLARRCAAQLLRQQQRERLAMPQLLELASSTSRLLVDGPERLARVVGQLDEQPSATAETKASSRPTTIAGAIAVVTATMMLWPPEVAALGANLWSAQALFVGAASIHLVFDVWNSRRTTA